MTRCLAMAVFSLLAESVMAETVFSLAMDEVNWQFQKQKYLQCEMKQTMPLLGDISFQALSGQVLLFTIESPMIRSEPDYTRLWLEYTGGQQRFIYDVELQFVAAQNGLQFRIQSLSVYELLGMLGRQARLTVLLEWYGQNSGNTQPSAPLRIELPVVNAWSVLTDMSTCSNQLLLRDFNELEFYVLHYPVGVWSVDDNQRQWLFDTARYLTTDPDINVVWIDGHTDSAPFTDSTETESRIKNLELSQKRAQAISNQMQAYFKELKIENPPQIRVRYHGFRYPVADNETQTGRRQNRRVEVTLERMTVPGDNKE